MPTDIVTVLILIAIVVIVIAWRIIAGEKHFNLFWRGFWSRTTKTKNVLIVIVATVTLMFGAYYARDAYKEYEKEQLRLKYGEKETLLKSELEKRGVPKQNTWNEMFGTQSDKDAAKRDSSMLYSRCAKEGKEIIVELNLKEDTPDIGEFHDYLLVSDVCQNWKT